MFLKVVHDLFCGDGKGIRSLLATVGVSSLVDVVFWCKVLRPDRQIQGGRATCVGDSEAFQV